MTKYNQNCIKNKENHSINSQRYASYKKIHKISLNHKSFDSYLYKFLENINKYILFFLNLQKDS